jgi:hypothetical protein
MAQVGTMVLMPDTVFVSAAELAEIIGADLETVNNWIRRGIIDRAPAGRRRLRNRLFSKEEVYKTALKTELVRLGILPSSSSEVVNAFWKDWDKKEPPSNRKLYAVISPSSNGKLTVALCTQQKSGGSLYKYKAGAKPTTEMDLPEQAFGVLPISAVLNRVNSRLSELLLGTTKGRFSRA